MAESSTAGSSIDARTRRAWHHPPIVPLVLLLCVGAVAAALVLVTVRAYAVSAARPRWHRVFTVLSGVLGAAGVSLLVAGSAALGCAAVGLAVEAFFCSVAFVGPHRPPGDGEDDDGGGGGGGGPPRDDAGGGDGIDWDRFAAEFEAYTQQHASTRR
jgi:hypothetical protein